MTSNTCPAPERTPVLSQTALDSMLSLRISGIKPLSKSYYQKERATQVAKLRKEAQTTGSLSII